MEAIRYLTDDERIRLLARAESRSYQPDDVILAEGAYNEDIFILTGLNAGDRVVVDGAMKVVPGQPVKIVEPGAPDSAQGGGTAGKAAAAAKK